MYDVIYRVMVNARVAVDIQDPVLMDPSGNVVVNDGSSSNFEKELTEPSRPHGHTCDTKLIHPE
jgi:hypothetical protein